MRPARRTRIALTLLGGAVLCVLAGLVSGCGPLGPIPGGALRGDVHQGPAPDWSQMADVEQIQLETNPDDPHSVNVWCGVHEGRLYVATSLILGDDDPMEREWVRNVVEDPAVRVRIDDTIYPLRAVRVEDDAEVAAVREVMLAKYDVEADDHVAQSWVFRLEPR